MARNFGWPIALMLLATASTEAASDTLPSHTEIIASIWWVPIVSALIGVVSALATPIVKDVLIQRSNERRSKSDKQHEIFRNYAALLAASCEKLIWRFYEIFIDSRHQFLKTATLPMAEVRMKAQIFNDV
jgi:hypothetical protein